jgi:hypothetical protein
MGTECKFAAYTSQYIASNLATNFQILHHSIFPYNVARCHTSCLTVVRKEQFVDVEPADSCDARLSTREGYLILVGQVGVRHAKCLLWLLVRDLAHRDLAHSVSSPLDTDNLLKENSLCRLNLKYPFHKADQTSPRSRLKLQRGDSRKVQWLAARGQDRST